MKFEGLKLSRFVMYNGWVIGLGMILLFMIMRPISAGKGFMFFEMFKEIFLIDYRLSLWFSFLIFLMQLAGYDCSRTKINFLEILEEKAIFHLLNGKIFEFKYSDLRSLEYTNDIYKIFLFTFKDGKKQKISNSVKNQEVAFGIINQKINESKYPLN
jgi:hypothetical protein